MNLYRKHCEEYLNKGFSVIPDGYKKKKPLIKGWNKYSVVFPTVDEVKQWGEDFKEANISVMLGEASGIIALDFDCVDPDILKLIEHLLPPSICEKIGSKGFTRFFQYKGEPTTVVKVKRTVDGKTKDEVVLELLSKWKKTTIPPSVHPKGMEYEWVGKSLLEVEKTDLPVFPPALIAHIESILQATNVITATFGAKDTTGRTLALGAKASEYISLNKDTTSAINDLIKYDKDNHKKPLFTDASENRGLDNAYLNALKFYSDYLRSINVKRLEQGKGLELPLSASVKQNLKPFNSASIDEEIFSLPEPTGTLKEIKDYIMARSYVEQPVFATSAAISLIGTLVGRDVTFQGATPNTYILNVGASGSGKDSCQQALKDLLSIANANNLLGATTYPSEASIISNLKANPVRLDIIDEASSFLKTAGNPNGASYAMGIGDTLCELFSCSNSRYLGKVLASNNGSRVGDCVRPHLNLLCSTTYKGIAEGLSRSTLEKGLFARFLVFFGDSDRRGKRVRKMPSVVGNFLEKLKYIQRFTNPAATGNLQAANPTPYEVNLTKEADDLLTKYHEIFDIKRISESTDNSAKPIIARMYQQMLKIVLISAVGNMEVDEVPKVTAKDVEFGYQLVNFFYQSIEGFVNDNLYDSQRGQKLNMILKLIKNTGDKGLSSTDLTKNTKSINLKERQEILTDLVQSAQISVEIQEGGNWTIFKEIKCA